MCSPDADRFWDYSYGHRRISSTDIPCPTKEEVATSIKRAEQSNKEETTNDTAIIPARQITF